MGRPKFLASFSLAEWEGADSTRLKPPSIETCGTVLYRGAHNLPVNSLRTFFVIAVGQAGHKNVRL